MSNTVTKMKNTVEGNSSRLPEAEEWISKLEDREAEITAREQKKERKELETVSETSGTT